MPAHFDQDRKTKTKLQNPNLGYAIDIIHAVCSLGGAVSFIDEIRIDLRRRGIDRAIRLHDTPALFDWLVEALSFQGISDAVAVGYMADHGTVRWSDVAAALAIMPSCPKLGGYWRFYDCKYHKSSSSCSEPHHIKACPLPGHPLRNGRLNQMAYSLFLFMRDIADGDLVAWLDRRLAGVKPNAPDRHLQHQYAVIDPLRNIYGMSDKVVTMTLASLFLGVADERSAWFNVGADLIAVDSLVHNFLYRTGILSRLSAEHPYGPACYRPGGCTSILRLVASHIDARQFNWRFPAAFPRFVQHAIWRYCAENGLDICNGNRIDDTDRCHNAHCQLFLRCDRMSLQAILKK